MNEVVLSPPPARNCDGCAQCCKLGEIPDFKPYNQWCRHCPTHDGCAIHATRPTLCRDFFCHYLRTPLEEHWRPDRCGMVIATYAGPARMTVQIDPDMPPHWQGAPYLPQLMQWAQEQFVSVVIGEQTYAIYPDRIEDLGIIGDGYTVEITEYETASGAIIRHARRSAVSP